jgi:hypothetical protein
MAIDNIKKSSRLLQSRRYTHDSFTDAQEAFTSTLDINANEVYVDQNLIPSSGLPFSGSSQSGSIYSVASQSVMKYHYRVPMTRSNLVSGSANEVWFFLTPSGSSSGIGAQLIDSNQQTNFISPKYSLPALTNSTTEDSTPGYGVKVFVSANATTPSAGDQVSINNYTFDYKTGVLQFTTNALSATTSQYVYITAYQYVGRVLKDRLEILPSTGSNTFTGNQIISGTLYVSSSFSASLQSGHAWVGDGNGMSRAVATSSFVTPAAAGTISASAQVDITQTTGYTTFSQSLSGTDASQSVSILIASQSAVGAFQSASAYSSSAATIDNAQNLRLNSLETFTASVAGTNTFTASVSNSLVSINSKTGSYATTGSNQFVGNQTITGSLIVSGSSGTTLLSSNVDTLLLTGSAIITGSLIVTGSLNVSGSITGSLLATNGIVSGSSQITISSTTGYTTFSQSFAGTNQSASVSILIASQSAVGAFQSASAYSSSAATIDAEQTLRLNSIETVTASVSNSLVSINSKTGSYATTGSNTFQGNQTINGTLTVTNIVTTTITSSTQYSSGSNIFGSSSANTHDFTGSVRITGSTTITGGNFTLSGTSLLNWDGNDGLQVEKTQIFRNYFGNYFGRIQFTGISAFGTSTVGLILAGWDNSTNALHVIRNQNDIGNHTYIGSTPSNANRSASFHVDTPGKGILLPRMSSAQRTGSILVPPQGLIVYDTGSMAEGFYYYSSGSIKSWTRLLNDTGSQIISGSLITTEGITGSLSGTASWATNALTASYVQASGVVGLNLSQISTGSVTASVNINSASFQLTSGSTSLLFVSNSGNIGIGTTAPTYKLDISGNIKIQSSGFSNSFDIFNGANSIFKVTNRSTYSDLRLADGGNGGPVLIGTNGQYGWNESGTGAVVIHSSTGGLGSHGGTHNNSIIVGWNGSAISYSSNNTVRIGNIDNLQNIGDSAIGIGVGNWGMLVKGDGVVNQIRLGGVSLMSGVTGSTTIGVGLSTTLSNVVMLGLSSQTTMIGQGTATGSGAILQIDSTTKGFLLSRMTEAQRKAISAPAQGLLVYDTGSVTEGLWYYNSGSTPGWQEVLTNTGSQSISGSITATNFTGSLFGTASWATNAVTASFASTSSFTLRGLVTASAAGDTITFTKGDGTTFNLTIAQSGTVSTASFVTASGVFGPFGSNSILSASYATTSSNVLGGAANYIPLWTGSTSLSSSVLYQSGSNIGIGTTSPTAKFQVSSSVVGDVIKANGTLNTSFTFFNDSFGRAALQVNGNTAATVNAGAYFTADGYEEAWFNVVGRQASSGNRYFRFGNLGLSNYFAIQKLNDAGTAIAGTPLTIFSSTGNVLLQGLGTSTTDDGNRLSIVGTTKLNGNTQITGSLIVTQGITGSLSGTASWAQNAVSASYASNGGVTQIVAGTNVTISPASGTGSVTINAAAGAAFPFTGSALITGSLVVTGSVNISGSITATNFTGSLRGTASWANNAISSSYPLIATDTAVQFASSLQVQSLLLGMEAGYLAPSAASSTFIGYRAGYLANAAQRSNFIGYQSGYSASNAAFSNFIGNSAGSGSIDASYSNFIGERVGTNATNADYSNFIGYQAGVNATNATDSNFIGYQAGFGATNAQDSNFIGTSAGRLASGADVSNFIGDGAGNLATNAYNSNFIGDGAGYRGIDAIHSNFIGTTAGYDTPSASYSNLIGYRAGTNFNFAGGARGIKSNNTIIGTNITLAEGAQDSINIGGLIFATGSYSDTAGDPFSGSANGKVGINQPNPEFNFDVSGSGRYTNGLTITGSLINGENVIASGIFSHAEGIDTIASGSHSHAEGYGAWALGPYTHAEGEYTEATGWYSHAEGTYSEAIGDYAHSEGDSAKAIGTSSHAEGYSTIARGNASHAEGWYTVASGSYSHAEGRETTTIGMYSHAEGYFTITSGSYSHAEGYYTTTSGSYSHAEGAVTRAIGNFSHAEGASTEAIGDYSHAEGLSTVASGACQHVQGQYNISSSAQSAFIIGNGTSNTARRNLVFASGSIFEITGSLNVSGSITGSLSGTASWATNALTAAFADNFIVRGTLTAQTIVVQTITSSTQYSSGSNIFGSSSANTHQFTGSVSITGSLTLPYLSTGSILFAGATDNITEDNTNFFWDNTNKRLGIGTNTPSTNKFLDIVFNVPTNGGAGVGIRNSNASGYSELVFNNDTTPDASGAFVFGYGGTSSPNPNHAYFWNRRNAPILFGTNGIERFRTTDTGNLHIGTFVSDTGERLQVSGSSRFRGDVLISGSGATSATNGLTVVNSGGTSTLTVRNDGRVSNGDSTFYVDRYSVGGTTMVISNTGHNGATGIQITSAVGIKAYSNLGVSTNNALGASIYAAGGNTNSPTNISLGLLSNRALITSTASGMNMHTSSMLQVDSTDQGFLLPRMSAAQRNAISTPARGLLVYDTDLITEGLWMYNSGSTPGWQEVLTNTGSQSISGSITATNFTGSLFGTASWATNAVTASYILQAVSASFATTSSYALNGGVTQIVAGTNVTISPINGMGSVTINAAAGAAFPFTGSALITGSLTVTGSISTTSTLNIGNSQFNNTSSVTVAGTTPISQLATGSYISAFYNYSIISSSNARAGQIMSIWSGSTVKYTEVTTTDIGNTSTASFAVNVVGGNVQLNFTAPGVWTVRTITTLL